MSFQTKNMYICTGCGDCCRWPGYVKVTDSEIDNIADAIGMSSEAFIEKYTYLTEDRKSLSIIDNELGHCYFFDDEKSQCKIYDQRPSQCRNFPLKWNFENWEDKCPALKLKYRIKKST